VQRVNFFEGLLQQVRSLPGVQAAGLVRAVPGSGYWGDSKFAVAEHPSLPPGQSAIVRWADPRYLAAIGIPLLRGQTFDDNQRLENGSEVIISDSFARRYFPGEDPLGKHLLAFGSRPYQIVGIVGDTRFHIAKRAGPIMYFPLYAVIDGNVANEATLAVHSIRDVSSFALPIQRIVQQLDPELALSDVLTMEQIVSKSTLNASFDATLLMTFAVLSLALATVGLFGVLSYIVARRTSEIGIRMALGAQRSGILTLTLVDGVRPASVGLVLGLAEGVGASKIRSAISSGGGVTTASPHIVAHTYIKSAWQSLLRSSSVASAAGRLRPNDVVGSYGHPSGRPTVTSHNRELRLFPADAASRYEFIDLIADKRSDSLLLCPEATNRK
jgi:MacB-like periplasmic core domain